jgi:IPT/TIG domain
METIQSTVPPLRPITNVGSYETGREGYYEMANIPILEPQYDWQNAVVTTEPINPLYIGQYAVGPYDAGAVAPSGTTPVGQSWLMTPYTLAEIDLPATTSTNNNAQPASGSASSPISTDLQGWWTACLCDYGRTAWYTLTVQANRTLTLEVTAQDEQGYTTASKMMPVIGLWNINDATGSLPTIAAAGSAFNSTAIGMTTVTAQSTQPQQLRIAIADQRGDGRPDYAFQGRVLYADSIVPASVPATGGIVTITGMGFRSGNAITINGVVAAVTSWSPTAIVATVPPLAALHSTTALSADVQVKDLTTGGTTRMIAALTYAAPVPSLNLVTAPSGTVAVGQAAAVPFTVQILQGDGVTPIPGQQVTFSATSGTAQFNACGATTCTLLTDSSGRITTTITPLTTGNIVLTATSSIGTQTVSFNAATLARSIVTTPANQYIAAGATITFKSQAELSNNIFPVTGVLVSWLSLAGPIAFTPVTSAADAQGVATAQTTAGPLPSGAQATASACAWTGICTGLTVQSVDPSQWRLSVISGAGQSISSIGTFAPVVLQVTDPAAHPIAGATIAIHQTLDAWQPPCPDSGRCPIAPIYSASSTTATSDTNGLLTITPLELPGVPTTTNIAAATGTQGFISFTLQKQH